MIVVGCNVMPSTYKIIYSNIDGVSAWLEQRQACFYLIKGQRANVCIDKTKFEKKKKKKQQQSNKKYFFFFFCIYNAIQYRTTVYV